MAVHHGAVIHLQRLELRLAGGERDTVPLDEFGGRRAARQGLEAEGARSGEQVQHARAWDGALQDAEPRLPHPIGGGAHAIRGGGLEAAAFELAGDDANETQPGPLPNAFIGSAPTTRPVPAASLSPATRPAPAGTPRRAVAPARHRARGPPSETRSPAARRSRRRA